MPDELIAGRYRLIEPLGRGAMSAVWLAEDAELGRRVAVKMLAPSADRQRFEREARAAAALSHPNIVSLYDYGEADGRPFMVLECLPKGSLEDRLRDGKPLPDDETRRIATDVAAGLAHAHDRGLVHRDLKPANILFDAEGRAKIADFGIARMGGTGTLTEAGTVLGTASYISPEQAAGETAGPASDVYSFGVMLFRMLTGVLPFVSSNAMELVRMHRDDPPPSVGSVRPDAPASLASVADAALAKDPADRPADGRAVFTELRSPDDTSATMLAPAAAALAAAGDAGATQVIRRPGGAATARRSLVPLAVLAAVLLVGGAALAFAFTHGSGGGGGGGGGGTTPGLSLPNVPSAGSTSTRRTTTLPTTSTTAPTTTAVTSAPTTTARTTTHPATTTHATTTTPATTHPATTAATTTAPPPPPPPPPPPTTTAATTTAPTTATTTAPPPGTTTVASP